MSPGPLRLNGSSLPVINQNTKPEAAELNTSNKRYELLSVSHLVSWILFTYLTFPPPSPPKKMNDAFLLFSTERHIGGDLLRGGSIFFSDTPSGCYHPSPSLENHLLMGSHGKLVRRFIRRRNAGEYCAPLGLSQAPLHHGPMIHVLMEIRLGFTHIDHPSSRYLLTKPP